MKIADLNNKRGCSGLADTGLTTWGTWSLLKFRWRLPLSDTQQPVRGTVAEAQSTEFRCSARLYSLRTEAIGLSLWTRRRHAAQQHRQLNHQGGIRTSLLSHKHMCGRVKSSCNTGTQRHTAQDSKSTHRAAEQAMQSQGG